MKTKISNYSKTEIITILNSSKSFKEVLNKLGYSTNGSGAYTSLKNQIKELGITIPKYHYYGEGGKRKKIDINLILVENSTFSRHNLKKRIIKEKIIEYKCSECGCGDIWNNKKLSLQLEHKNGINNDNRIDNLTFLCPNCHSQSETYSGKNRKIYDNEKNRAIKKYNKNINNEIKNKIENKKNYCKCGKEILSSSKMCNDCKSFEQRKIKNRPSIEILLNDVNINGYEFTGRKYNVSGNTIKKWIIRCGIEPPKKQKIGVWCNGSA